MSNTNQPLPSSAEVKAKELMMRMYSCPHVQESQAIRCALVAVDIILSDLVTHLVFRAPVYSFYESVKDELLKLKAKHTQN